MEDRKSYRGPELPVKDRGSAVYDPAPYCDTDTSDEAEPVYKDIWTVRAAKDAIGGSWMFIHFVVPRVLVWAQSAFCGGLSEKVLRRLTLGAVRHGC